MPGVPPTAPTTGRKCSGFRARPAGRSRRLLRLDSPGHLQRRQSPGTVVRQREGHTGTRRGPTREGEHIVLKLDRDKVTVSRCRYRRPSPKLDRTYEAYRDPGDALRRAQNHDPQHAGHRTRLLGAGRQPDPVGTAVAAESAARPHGRVRRLGLRHHPRDRPCLLQGNIFGTGRWNWNDEIFANFRMSYAPESATVRCRSATSATGVPT